MKRKLGSCRFSQGIGVPFWDTCNNKDDAILGSPICGN